MTQTKKKKRKLPKGWRHATKQEDEELFDSLNPLALLSAHNEILTRERNN